MKTRFLTAFMLATPFAGQALAADIADTPVPTAGGFYAGVQAGGASGDLSMKEYDTGTSDPSGYTADIEATGVIGGIYAGFNYVPTEHFLFGVEADMNYAGLDDDNYLDYEGSKDEDYLYGWNTGLQGSLRARAGFIAGNALIYATGGLALGNNTFEVFEEDSNSNSEDIDEMMVGWTAGGGVEYAFTAHWSARIEYRYTDFGDVTITPDISDYDGDYDNEIEVTQQSLMVGLGYAF